jgi:hypothetical protein
VARTVLMVPPMPLLSARLPRLLLSAAMPVDCVAGTTSHGCASAWVALGLSEGL